MYSKFSTTQETAYGAQGAKTQRRDYDGVACTPADATALPNGIARGLIVTGNAGNIAGTTPSGATFVLTSVPANTIVPIDVSIVASTSTTATGIYVLY